MHVSTVHCFPEGAYSYIFILDLYCLVYIILLYYLTILNAISVNNSISFVSFSWTSGAGGWETQLLFLQVQSKTDVYQGPESSAVGLSASTTANVHCLPADPSP